MLQSFTWDSQCYTVCYVCNLCMCIACVVVCKRPEPALLVFQGAMHSLSFQRLAVTKYKPENVCACSHQVPVAYLSTHLAHSDWHHQRLHIMADMIVAWTAG